MRSIFLLLFFCANFISFSQNKRLDSLLKVSKSDKGKPLVKTLNNISWEYRNVHPDSAMFYAKKALEVASSIEDDKSIASAYNSIAAGYEILSQLDSALIYHEKSLKLKKNVNDTIGIADTYNNLGIVYDTQGNYTQALENYFKALRIYEDFAKDFDKVPMVYVNIGIVYKKQKEYQKVLDYYKKALLIYQEHNYQVGEVITMGNIGSLLLSMEDFKESIWYSQKAKKLYAKLGYNRYVSYMDANIAIAKDSLKLHDEARLLYLKAIKAFKEDSNLYELANTKVGLAYNYSTSNNYLKSQKYLNEALKITRENNYKEIEIKALKQLAEVSAMTGNYKTAFNSYRKYAKQKDSVFETEKTKTVFELETKYKTEKKEKQILIQRAELAEQDLIIQKRNYQIYGLIGLALLFGLLGYLLYNQQKLKNKQLQKENELKDALLKIETQNRLQDQRLRISRDLHDNIGAQLTFIISSLDNLKYGFEIPEKLESKVQTISEFTSNTIYELRDTIWAMNKNQITFEDLQSRISNFIDKAKISSENIQFNFNLNPDIEKEVMFTSVEGMNLYRIIQESINNAIKYAKPKKVEVVIAKQKNHDLIISITDDGKGFNKDEVEMGNGINNMKKRVLELKGELLIDSQINQGTTIKILMPINTHFVV